MELKILTGNIIDAKTDAVVLPANSSLKEGSGVSAALFKAAGKRKLAKKCDEIGFCDVGSAVPTLGYDMDVSCIIHAVVPKWIDGNHNEYELLSSAYASALEIADFLECKSIVFPLLAAGNNGFDQELAFQIAAKSIEEYQSKNLETATLVIYKTIIANQIKEKGYSVSVLVRSLEKDREELERIAARKAFIEKQLIKGIEYFKDPKHREEIIKFGVEIAKKIFK